MRLTRALAATAALTVGSGFVAQQGLAAQERCFASLESRLGVESYSQLPEQVQDGSGCVNVWNTLGTLGTASGLAASGAVVVIDRRQKHQSDLSEDGSEAFGAPVPEAVTTGQLEQSLGATTLDQTVSREALPLAEL